MGLLIASRKNKDLKYYFSDRSPEGLLDDSPHLSDNFFYSPSKVINAERLIEVFNDCAHPELKAAYEIGIDSAIRFIQAFKIKASPLYVYRINTNFYTKERTTSVA